MQTLTMDAAARETQIDRLLAAARETIVQVPFCWVVTPTPDGLGANARVVNAQPGGNGEDFWTRWFLTPRIGRKAAEIQATARVTLAYQHDSGKAYVALSGPAELLDDREEVERRFRGSAHDDPQGITAASLIAVKVDGGSPGIARARRNRRTVGTRAYAARPRHQPDMAPRLR